ncbi:hypothetical protein BJX63DRAFT_405932 [Aspergillus granulosus]|uniref:Zn(2)-C6 fungal-type domain-containing protein n=1 Tax=Aspergillus granulosus TaxID=176169 RepID=A0ABR4H1N2_9EURO
MPFPQVELTARRRKVANACDFCREHRVRCETATPCPPCAANNVPCVRSRPPHTPGKRNRVQRSSESNHQQDAQHTVDTNLIDDLQNVEEASPPTPSPSVNLAWTSHKTDSILGFIARINAFCAKMPQQGQSTNSSGYPSLDQTLPFLSGMPQETRAAECDLSPVQINRTIKIFWARLRPLMPIVQWNDVNPSSQQAHGAFQPLQDAITGYTLHYIYCSGLHTRLVGLDWPQFQRGQSTIGFPYFQRSLSAVTQFATFARPSLAVMQCYCYLTLYLLDAGQHHAAYIMVGLGLRISQSLNYMDIRNGRYQECQLFRHVWWTLIHLEFRCSRHVGKPVTSHVDSLAELSPSRELEDTDHSSSMSYHIESIRLTVAVLAINETMDRHSSTGTAGHTNIARRAEILSARLDALKQWRDELPQQESFVNLPLDIINTSVATPDIPLDDSIETLVLNIQDPQADIGIEEPPMLTLQNTLLSLQYHNTTMTLHRIFIQFPSPCPSYTPSSNIHLKTTPHAATALQHAQTIAILAHSRLSTNDIHHGHAEIYQYVWNAVITIIGFMLAYPFCHRCQTARQCLDLALEVFRSARADTAAARAAELTRQLCAKVDELVTGLKGQFDMAGSSIVSGEGGQGTRIHVPAESWSGTQGGGGSTDTATASTGTTDTLSGSNNGQPLWAWDELSNLDAWPSYCDEVYEAFMVDPMVLA